MSGDWDIERYQAREQEWRQKAEKARSSKEQETCLLIAQGYAELIAVARTAPSPSKTTAA